VEQTKKGKPMPPKIPYKQVKVNLRPEQHQELSRKAEALGITIAELLRQSVGQKIDKVREPRAKRTVKQTDPALLYELHKIGNNINQLAKHANTNKALDRTILDALSRIENELKRFVK
jgi:hypothetical protein